MSLTSEQVRTYKPHLPALAVVVLVCFLGFLGVNETTSHLRLVSPEQGKRDGIGELVGSSRACQTFMSPYNNLNQIEIMLSNYDRQNTGPFLFHLRHAPDDEKPIVTLTLDASIVKKTDYVLFEFPPIPDSGEQTYAFCLEAPEAELLNSITALGVLGDTYLNGEAIFRDMWGQKAGISDLDFRVGYALSAWDKLVVFAEQLTRYKPLICGDWRLYVLLGISYLALLYGLVLKIAQPSTDAQD
jgi:hypothetical protein